LFLASSTPLFAQTGTEAYVNFSFDNADIRMVIKLAGEMTGKRFIVDDDVQGKVTVVTPPQIPLSEVYPLFLSVLEGTGFTVVDRGPVSHVVKVTGTALPSSPVVGSAEDLPANGGMVTKIFELKHISALELKNALAPLIAGGAEGSMAAFAGSNHLLVTDSTERLQRLKEILDELDRPGASRAVEVIALEHADADDMANHLNRALAGMESSANRFTRQVRQVTEGAGGLPSGTSVVAIPHANSLIIAGAPTRISEMKNILAELDVESESGAGNLHVIFLKYLDAEEGAKSLNALLAKSNGTDQQQNQVAIEPSIANNALLVNASPRDFQLVQGLVDKLDQVPQQVMIEVTIAEVTMGDALDLGVEWSTIEVPSEGSTTFIGRSRPDSSDFIKDLTSEFFFPQGLNLALAKGTYTDAAGNVLPSIPVFIRALAEDREVEILSNVPLWAQDNKEASVSVVDNIPILSSTIQGGSGTSRDVIQNIERIDVGIKLTLTPHVNPNDEVSIELNPSIEAIVDEGPDGSFAPTIARRDVSTTVTIPNESTVIISGLMREDSINVESKVPFLGDIPFLGAFFRSTSVKDQKSNLLIFVTPHIVTDLKQADELRERYETRTGLGEPVDLFLNGDPDGEAAAESM